MSLKRNTLWNLIGTGLPLLLGAITIPYLIRTTGVEAFGVLTLIWALIGYFSLFDFGLGRALTQQVAAARSAGLFGQLPRLVKTGLWFTAATGVVGGILLAIFASQLAFHWLKVSAPLQTDVERALLIAAVGIPLTTVTTGLRGILEAYEDFKTVNLLRISLGVANFGLPALSVMLIGPSLAWMVVFLVVARFVAMCAHLWLVNQKLPDGWRAGRFDRGSLRNLLSFGAWMTVSNIVSPLMVTADRFVISAVVGASAVAYYTVPYEVLSRVLLLPAALTSALFPRLALMLINNHLQARNIYKKCLLVTVAIMISICLPLVVGSKWGLEVWLGKLFSEKSWIIFCILTVGVFFNGIALVPFTAIQASGDARSTAILHLCEFIVYFPLLFLGLKQYGLVGAAIVWSVRTGFDLIFLIIIGNRKLLPKK